jgi:hypothetical protein
MNRISAIHFATGLLARSSWVTLEVAGRVILRHGVRETVSLEEVEVGDRAPILRRYLDCAPGARAHVPVDRHAPLAEFDRIAAQFPVFRISQL